MIDFPSAPAVGQEFTGAGTTFIWNGQGWIVKPATGSGDPVDSYTKAESDQNFVNISGDTMTGNLIIHKAEPMLAVSKPSSGSNSLIVGSTNNIARWGFLLGNNTTEAGANTGSDFQLNRYNDAGIALGSVLTINRAGGGWSTTSQIGITRAGINTIVITSGVGSKYLGFGIDTDGHAKIMVNDQTDIVFNASASREIGRFFYGGGLLMNPVGTNRPGIQVLSPAANYSIQSQAQGGFAAVIGFDPDYGHYGMLGFANATYYYSFYGNANAYLAGGTWNTSDLRFKQYTAEVTFDATARVKAVPVKSFSWKPGQPMGKGDLVGETSFGWIAQDVIAHIPTAVADIAVPPHDLELRAFLADVPPPTKDTPEAEALSKRSDLTFKAINDHYMVAVLWKAVQELVARVETLEAAAAPTKKPR